MVNVAVLVRQAGHGLLVTHGKSRGKMFGFLLLHFFLGLRLWLTSNFNFCLFVGLLIFNSRRKEEEGGSFGFSNRPRRKELG